MLKEIEETTPTTRKLKIDIPSSVIEEEIAAVYVKLGATAKIPGFRAGKVPKSILEKKFGKDVEAQVLEKVVPLFYSNAVKEANIFPITYPEIDGKLAIEENQSVSFTATVEIKPELTDLNYESIEIKKRPFSVEVSELDAAMKALQESRTVLKVTKTPLKEGDVAVIDCDALIDDKEVEELKSKDYPFIIGSQAMPKEFSDALSGKKKGENFEVSISFESDLPNKTIAGKEVLFKVSVTETKEKILPDMDDEFAKGFNCGGIDELREKISENIRERKQTQTNNEYKKEIVEKLISSHEVEIPASMINNEIKYQIEEAEQEAMRNGKAVEPEEKLRVKIQPAAIRNVKEMLVLDAIGKKEKIEVSDDDIKQAVEEIAAQHDIKSEDVKKLYITKEGSMDGLKHRLYSGKVMDFVLSKAVIK